MVLKIALKHLLSKPFLALCTLVAVSGALSILGVFWTLVENMERVRMNPSAAVQTSGSDNVAAMEAPTGPALTVFVDPALAAPDNAKLQAALRADTRYKSVTVVSAEEAQRTLENEFGETLGKVFSGDTLPATYRLELAKTSFTRDELLNMLNDLRATPGVLDVEEGAAMSRFQTQARDNRLFTWATGLFFIVFAIVSLLVSHLIRIAFETLRPEVETLKVLGASRFWIFKPLLIEGLFLGILGAVTSIGLLTALIHLVLPKVSDLILPKGITIDSLSAQASLQLILMSVGASVVGALFTWPLIHRAPTQV